MFLARIVETHLVNYTEYPSTSIARIDPRIDPDDEDLLDDEYQEDT